MEIRKDLYLCDTKDDAPLPAHEVRQSYSLQVRSKVNAQKPTVIGLFASILDVAKQVALHQYTIFL
jgi:hypothetical protein